MLCLLNYTFFFPFFLSFFRNWLVNQLQSLLRLNAHCEEQLLAWNRQLHLWQKFHVIIKDMARLLPGEEIMSSNSLESFLQLSKSHYSDVSNQMASVTPSVKQLCQRVVRDESLAKEWASTNRACGVISGVSGKSSTYVTRLKESWQHLLRDRAARGKFVASDYHVANSFLFYYFFYSFNIQ